MSFIDSAIESIGNFLGETSDIRGSILGNAPEQTPVKQEATHSFRQPVIDIEETQGITTERDIEDFSKDEESFIPIDVRSDEEINKDKNKQYNIDSAVRNFTEDKLSVKRTKGQAIQTYMEGLKKRENASNKGLVMVNGQKRFMPFKSISEKEEKGNSEYEIGYGQKVEDKWLSDKESDWPVIQGIPVNVKEGISQEQAEFLLAERTKRDRVAIKKEFKTWDKMTEEEKLGWQDLAYNGGTGAINKNPKAKAAANAGHTLEGLVRLFDYNKAGKNRYRGLFTRRINVYNKAALSITGAPVVEEYKWKENEVWIKFSSKIRSDKFSDKFINAVNNNDGWYKVPGPGGSPKTAKVGENFQFA